MPTEPGWPARLARRSAPAWPPRRTRRRASPPRPAGRPNGYVSSAILLRDVAAGRSRARTALAHAVCLLLAPGSPCQTDDVRAAAVIVPPVSSPLRRHATRCPRSQVAELRRLGNAAFGVPQSLAQPAPGVEAAAGRRVGRGWDVALQDDPLLAVARVRIRDRRQQGDGVRVARMSVDLIDGGQLRHHAQVHDPDPVADVLDDGQVVGDEEIGQPQLLLEVVEEVQDLALDRDIERRDRFVEDHEFRVEGEGTGDADALALAARELVRVAMDVALVQAHLGEQLADQLLALLLVRHPVDQRALTDDLADRHAGVQAGVRILEDDLEIAADRLHRLAAQ